jgi:hypothetical protein
MAPARAQQNGIELEVRRDTQVADFELKYPPGSYPGWHKHPGIVIANVKSGAVWRQIGCTATKVSKGELSLKSHRTMCRTVVPDPTAKKYDRGAGDHPAVTPPAQKPPISASTSRRRVARTGSATSSNPPSILGTTHSGWRESLAGRRKVIAAAGADSSRDGFGRPALPLMNCTLIPMRLWILRIHGWGQHERNRPAPP